VRQKEENLLKIERVAVLFEFRRLKVGSTLINNIIQYFINLNDSISFVLHSQVAVADFYKSINFISYGDKFFEDGIPHIAMKYIKS
jgi:predicted GNAT family N-acyltransferase